MTATYEKSGLQFMYPENWSLAEDDMQATPRTVSVQAPTGAFWSVDIYPFGIDIEQLLDQIVATMKEEYNDLEAEPVPRSAIRLDWEEPLYPSLVVRYRISGVGHPDRPALDTIAAMARGRRDGKPAR